jgi:4-hydroxybenzoate polyprenyltransferase
MAFLRLMRPLNLIIIAFTMYAMRWGVIHTIAQEWDSYMPLQLHELKFALSTLVMVLLAAAGNIINDYFDIRTDRINKPDRVVVGKLVKRRVAMVSHHIINGLATLLGIYLAWDSGIWILAVIPIFMGTSLWFYSLQFKKQAWIGNFVVALMIGIVPMWAGVFELPLLAKAMVIMGKDGQLFAQTSWLWLLGFSGFAFWLTLIREAQKDMEDLRGDQISGFKTLPILWGIGRTKQYVFGLHLVFFLFMGLVIAQVIPMLSNQTWKWMLLGMVTLTIGFPLFYGMFKSLTGDTSEHFAQASAATKWAMAGGILIGACMPFWFVIAQ